MCSSEVMIWHRTICVLQRSDDFTPHGLCVSAVTMLRLIVCVNLMNTASSCVTWNGWVQQRITMLRQMVWAWVLPIDYVSTPFSLNAVTWDDTTITLKWRYLATWCDFYSYQPWYNSLWLTGLKAPTNKLTRLVCYLPRSYGYSQAVEYCGRKN